MLQKSISKDGTKVNMTLFLFLMLVTKVCQMDERLCGDDNTLLMEMSF